MPERRVPEWATYDWGPETTAGAEELRRLDNAKVGADHQNEGKYAVYFYDDEDAVVRSVGGFEVPKDAAKAIPFIRAEAILEAAAVRYRQALEDIAGHFLPGDERRTYGSATHTLDRIRDTVREALAE